MPEKQDSTILPIRLHLTAASLASQGLLQTHPETLPLYPSELQLLSKANTSDIIRLTDAPPMEWLRAGTDSFCFARGRVLDQRQRSSSARDLLWLHTMTNRTSSRLRPYTLCKRDRESLEERLSKVIFDLCMESCLGRTAPQKPTGLAILRRSSGSGLMEALAQELLQHPQPNCLATSGTHLQAGPCEKTAGSTPPGQCTPRSSSILSPAQLPNPSAPYLT